MFGSDGSRDGWFVQHGWIFLVSLFVWAILSSNHLARSHSLKKLAEAKIPTNTVGHAKHGSTETLTDKDGGIRLGFDKLTGKILRNDRRDGGHGLVVGATGSGKGTTFIIPALLDLAGRASMIFADFKGNTTAVCGDYLASKGKLIVCSPYENQKGLFPMKLPKSTPCNPLAGLSPDNYGFTAECERIAETFVDGNLDLRRAPELTHLCSPKMTQGAVAEGMA